METVIIYRLGSLGDTIVALPCFHKIADAFPLANRIVLTNFPVSSKAAPLQAILDGSGLVSGAISYPVGTRSALKLWQLSREMRRVGSTTMIYLMPARGWFGPIRDLIYFRLCGIKRIVGFPRSAERRKPKKQGAGERLERECERLARTLAELGEIDLNDARAWDLLLTEREIAAGLQITAGFAGVPIIALNMGGKAVEKDWGTERWIELLDVLARTHSTYGLLIVGSTEDSARAQIVTRGWPNKVVDACGLLSPRESAAAMHGAKLFIGHDSGPLHLAAASQIPCVGMYGSFNAPEEWHPFGDRHQIIHRMDGISKIAVNDVAQAVLALLPPDSQNAEIPSVALHSFRAQH